MDKHSKIDEEVDKHKMCDESAWEQVDMRGPQWEGNCQCWGSGC